MGNKLGRTDLLSGRSRLGMVFVPFVILLLAGIGFVARHPAVDAGKAAKLPLELRSIPITIRPQPRPVLKVAMADLSEIRSKVQPFNDAGSVSLFLHASRVFDLDARYNRGKLATNRETLRLFADEAFSEKTLGTALTSVSDHYATADILCSSLSMISGEGDS